MLADRDSSDLHLNLARRHLRLARRYKQSALIAAMQTVIDGLSARKSIAEDKELDRQAAYDDTFAADGDLDDAIRNLFSAAETHDRENLGAGMLAMLFPSGGFGELVELPLTQEPTAADAIATKITTLGATHPLAPHAAKLSTAAQAVRDSLAALDSAVRAAKTADAEEEIAQGKLRRQYEHNYLAARQELSRSIAERLFPKANRPSTSTPASVTGTPAKP